MTTITALPTPPSRDDPANFKTRADAFLGALPTFATETNTVAGEVNTNAGTATTKAAEALASANNAAASASSAIAASGAALWTSGTYAVGDVRWSPSTYFSYRCKTSGSRTIDPALDAANWVQINGSDAPWQIKTGNYTAVDGDRLLCDTSTASFTVTLPATGKVTVSDYKNTFDTKPLNIARNGVLIEGLAEDDVCDIKGETRTYEYVDAVIGRKVY